MVEYRFATDEQKELAMDARRIMEKELKPRIEELEHANDGKPCRSSKSFSCPRKPPRRNGGKCRLLPAAG